MKRFSLKTLITGALLLAACGPSLAGPYPFSKAVVVGDMVYLSGEVGLTESGKLVPGGVKAETKQVMANIQHTLAKLDLSMDSIVQCQLFIKDINEWPAVNDVYKTFFKDGKYPARSAFATGSTDGAGLALGARIEAQCLATTSTIGYVN